MVLQDFDHLAMDRAAHRRDLGQDLGAVHLAAEGMLQGGDLAANTANPAE